MSARAYATWMRVIAVLLAILIGFSIALEMPLYIPLIGVMVALLIANVLRRYVREVITDERNRRIDEKATSMSYRIYTVVTAIFVLVVLSLRSSLPSWAGIAGETLAYSLCGLMLLHLFSYNYYYRKL